MRFDRKLRLALTIGTVTSALSLGLVTPPASGARAPSRTITYAGARGARARSRTITYAEAPGASPDWIFPFTGYLYFSTTNVNQFQELMFRPLYFFGLGKSAAFVPSLSLANQPVMSNGNKTITIDLKGWRFADGQVVNAQSVMFFLNLYEADPMSYEGYTPGVGIPDQLASASGSGNTVVLHLKSAVNPDWILYNYLSEITPLPNSWDLTGPHLGGKCATGVFGASSTDLSCKNVEVYLDKMSSNTNTYATNFWQSGDDGPWKLTRFDSLGNARFEANTKYSGPQRAQVKYVKEIAYTSGAAEESDLQAGKIDLGYIDPTNLKSSASKPGKVGANLASLNQKYRLSVVAPYSFNYAQLNFSTSNPLQAEFNQLYIRQALQESFGQNSVLQSVDNNYGVVGYSPLPPNSPASLSKTPTNPYPFNVASAKALLTSHGWTETSGVMACTSPGIGVSNCGADIALGDRLSFTFMYVTGDLSIDNTVNAMVSDWASVGIDVTATANTANNLFSECSVGSGTDWSICWSGEGWTYEPNYYPSGEQLFLSGADANWGSYDNARMNSLIKADTAGTSSLSAFEQYAADQLPVLFMPNGESTHETNRSLKSSIGWAPNALQNFLPEYLHF